MKDKFKEIFTGLDRAFGIYHEDKNRAETKQGSVTEDLYAKHLGGKQALGIVPINENNQCVFGAIDIDDHKKDKNVRKFLDHKALARKIGELDLPLVVARSRTGGIHCFHFVKEAIPARVMINRLTKWATILGHGGCEIFPKQVMLEKSMTGNWINLPYYKSVERYAFNEDGKALSLNGFIQYVNKCKEKNALDINIKKDMATKAPPCLNIMYLQGIPEGERNEAMFSFAVYCKKAYGDNWKEVFYKINYDKVNPPLSTKELGNIARSVNKKDYRYKCKGEPLKSFCDPNVCLKKENGIEEQESEIITKVKLKSKDEIVFEIGELTKINSVPPNYVLEVNGKEVSLTVKDLMNYTLAQGVIMAAIDRMPPKMKAQEWRDLIDTKMLTMIIEEPPEEISDQAYIIEALRDFYNLGDKLLDKEMLHTVAAKYDLKGTWYIGFQLKNFEFFMKQRKLAPAARHDLYYILKKEGYFPSKVRISTGLLSVWQRLIYAPEIIKKIKQEILI